MRTVKGGGNWEGAEKAHYDKQKGGTGDDAKLLQHVACCLLAEAKLMEAISSPPIPPIACLSHRSRGLEPWGL